MMPSLPFARFHGGIGRVLCAAVGLGASATFLGCATTNPVKTPAPVAREPVADEATRARNWPVSVAYYHSGATEAWPTRWYYQPNPDYEGRLNYITDPVMFLVQTLSLPVTLGSEPPFDKKVIYAGDVLPPSYSAMPPLPPALAQSQNNPDPDPLVAPRPKAAPMPPPSPRVRPAPMIVPPRTMPATTQGKAPAGRFVPGTRPATMPS